MVECGTINREFLGLNPTGAKWLHTLTHQSIVLYTILYIFRYFQIFFYYPKHYVHNITAQI